MPLGVHEGDPPDGLPINSLSVPDAILDGWFAVGVTPESVDKYTYRAWAALRRAIGA